MGKGYGAGAPRNRLPRTRQQPVKLPASGLTGVAGNRAVSTVTASSFLNAAGTVGE
jgi:hypothetical protein